ncbi:MAG TPA: zinc-binding dehydrogenase [Actinomycetota bacterium]|jgi:putative PIG3 family NAD(P)H quinone oxidoreductase|nr:zinc-binding dehydrogenase [Actinomycetota bacterium]
MRAVTIDDGRLVVAERPDPEPGRSELLVRVAAAGLNGADLLQARGGYPPPPGIPADLPGLELAGEVAATGPGVQRFKPGDRVMALVGGAGQAELAVVHERTAIGVPDGLGWPEAGGFPEAVITAHDALFTQCGLGLGDRLLVHGAAGGVGTAAVQLGAAAGATVVATVRDPGLHQAVADLGADVVVEPGRATAHGPFDVVLELVGAPNFAANLDALATGGRLMIIGVGAGASVELDLRQLMGRRARLLGSTLRPRPLEEKADAARRVEHQVLPLLADGRLRVPVAATFPLEAAQDAYDRFAAGSKLGKLVLVI